MIGNAYRMRLCNYSSFVLNHPLSANKNVSDFCFYHMETNKQNIKTTQQFLSTSADR